MKRIDLAYNLLQVPVDFILLIAASLAAYFLRVSPLVADIRPVLFNLSLGYFLTLAAGIAFFMLAALALSGLYSMRRRHGILQEASVATIALSAGMMLVIIFMFFNRAWFDSRFIILAGWGFSVAFVIAGRLGMRAAKTFLTRRFSIGVDNVLLVGRGEEMERIKEQIYTNKRLGLRLAGHLDAPDINLIAMIHKTKPIHRVVLTNSRLAREEALQVVSFCEEHRVQFSYIPDLFGSLIADMDFDVFRGAPVVSVRATPLDGWGKVLKRALDICGAVCALVIFSPLFVVVAFFIKWESAGPVLVRQRRAGEGREFDLYKFRSMINNAHEYRVELAHLNERTDGPLFKIANDPRVTRVGKVLRSRRFDELPQLFNVLVGDISLVGPRPHEPQEVQRYKHAHKKVFAIKPGITGFAQVNGASFLPFEEEVKLDRYYIEHWSIKMDIAILLKTAWMFFFDSSGV